MGAFNDSVYELVRQIPRGRVASYGQVARMVGSPRNARFVGYALHVNPEPGVIPCHRVVFKDGHLAPGFAFGGPDAQRELLEAEGVAFLDDGRVDMSRYQWEA
ncbi:MAG: MGMT family protein [Coriobacteriales bacterium]|nr:MGMT family protein [Coriobacteriales bacterium]